MTGLEYKLYKVGSSTPVGTLGNYNNDTLYYSGTLQGGLYIVIKETYTPKGSNCIHQRDGEITEVQR